MILNSSVSQSNYYFQAFNSGKTMQWTVKQTTKKTRRMEENTWRKDTYVDFRKKLQSSSKEHYLKICQNVTVAILFQGNLRYGY